MPLYARVSVCACPRMRLLRRPLGLAVRTRADRGGSAQAAAQALAVLSHCPPARPLGLSSARSKSRVSSKVAPLSLGLSPHLVAPPPSRPACSLANRQTCGGCEVARGPVVAPSSVFPFVCCVKGMGYFIPWVALPRYPSGCVQKARSGLARACLTEAVLVVVGARLGGRSWLAQSPYWRAIPSARDGLLQG